MGVRRDDPGCLAWRGSHQLSSPPPNLLRGPPPSGPSVTRNPPGRSRHVHYMSSTCISWLHLTSKAPAIRRPGPLLCLCYPPPLREIYEAVPAVEHAPRFVDIRNLNLKRGTYIAIVYGPARLASDPE